MDIKRFTPEDIDAAVRLVRTLKNEYMSPQALGRFLDDDGNYLIVAFIDDQPAGWVVAYELKRVDTDRAMMYMHEVEVAPGHHRKGVGRAMIDALKRICRRRNILKMFVITGSSNRAAVRLYESTGGRPIPGDDVVFDYKRF